MGLITYQTLLVRICIASAACLTLAHCGDEKLKGYSPPNQTGEGDFERNVNSSGRLDDDGTVVAENGMYWLWQCTPPAEPARITENGEVEVFAEGPHQVQISGGPMEIAVNLNMCTAQQRTRDIVFVVDVSKRARDADPESNDSCARMEAIENMLAALPEPERVRAALVTYDNKAVMTTSLSTVADFRQAYITTNDLCDARLLGPQNATIEAGMELVESILVTSGRANAEKEAYLITLSEPKNSTDGGPESAALRVAGVTIMTHQIDNNSGVAENEIASAGYDDQPLHRRYNNANSFKNALVGDDAAPFVGGTIRYKATGRDEFEDETDMFVDGTVELYSLGISGVTKTSLPEGIDLEFHYYDDRGRPFYYNGSLTWK